MCLALTASEEAVRHRLARHEAAHAFIAITLSWRIKLVRLSIHGGSLVDLWPSFQTPRYRDPAALPLLTFLMADTAAFRGGEYDGPLPATLPPGGTRIVADVMAVLLAGYCIDPGLPADSYRVAAHTEGSDAAQVEILLRRYPECAVIRDTLLGGWLRQFLADSDPAIGPIADALLRTEAGVSDLGADDINAIRAAWDSVWFAAMVRRLNAELDGLAYLAELNAKAAA